MSKHFTRGQIGQALECAYIEASELEEVIDNVLVMLRETWDEGARAGYDLASDDVGAWDVLGDYQEQPDNPYKEENK